MTTVDRYVNRADFVQAVALVAKHTVAEKEVKAVPQFAAFRCIKIDFHRTYLTMTATQRYTICEDAVANVEDRHSWQRDTEVIASCLVDVGDLERIVKGVSRKTTNPQSLRLVLNPDQRVDTLVIDELHDMPTQDWCRSFPKVQHLLVDTLPDAGSVGFDVDADMLALFARKLTARHGEQNMALKVYVSGKNCGDLGPSFSSLKRDAPIDADQPALWAQGKPLQVRFGGHLRGCVMLMRPVGDPQGRP